MKAKDNSEVADFSAVSAEITARTTRARKYLIWGRILLVLGILTIYAGGLLLLIASYFVYKKRRKIVSGGPILEREVTPAQKAKRNKLRLAAASALVVIIVIAAATGGAGSPLDANEYNEQQVLSKLSGTFSAHGQRVKNPLYGAINGQIEYQDFTNYKYYISLARNYSATLITKTVEGDYGGVHLSGGASWENTSYGLRRTTSKDGSPPKEVWVISFSNAPLSFLEKEFLICEKGFKSYRRGYGDYSYTKDSERILNTREDVADFCNVK